MKFQGKDGKLRIYERHGGYIEVHFSNMDFTSQIGRAPLEEKLVLDRGNVTEYGHYISGTDQAIFDPFGLSFSCSIDDVTHVNTTNGWKEIIYQALICRDGRNDETDATWTKFGASTKGQYSNKPGILNPRFLSPTGPSFASHEITNVNYLHPLSEFELVDIEYEAGELDDCLVKFTSGAKEGEVFLIRHTQPFTTTTAVSVDQDIITNGIVAGDTCELYPNYRTVDIEYKLHNSSIGILWAFQEVYFPPNEITFSESEEAITMTATGGVYGPVVRSNDWIVPTV